ncbi:MAG: hypothetical protein KAY37_01005 [Phycisphaerae bacterium]|nr:hypothetical protein [Phycisphaerae bacterium]
MPVQTAAAGRGDDRLELGRPIEQFPLATLGMIGQRIMPVFPVRKKSAKISVVTRAGMLRPRDTRRQDGATFSRDTFDIDELSYACDGHGHEQKVTKAQREVYRSDFDADQYARGQVEKVLLTAQERRIAALIFDPSVWTGADLYTDVGTDWDNAAATIVSDIEAAKEKCRLNTGLEPNTMVISSAHLPNLKLNTQIRAFFPGIPTLTENILMGNLPAIFGLETLLIGNAVYNSANEGQAFAGSRVWSDDYCWIGTTVNGGDIVQPCVGRTFQWDAFGAAGFEWDFYTEKQTKTDLWQGEHWIHEKVIDEYFGHLLKIDT